MTTITDEKLDALIAGAEKATPDYGAAWDWCAQQGSPGRCNAAQVWDAVGDSLLVVEPTTNPDDATAIAAHIARCDPATIKALCEEVRRLRHKEWVLKAVLGDLNRYVKTGERASPGTIREWADELSVALTAQETGR